MPNSPMRQLAGTLHDNVFIATPTHICKRYCASRFLTAVELFAPGAFHCIVDNSGSKSIKAYYPEKENRHVDSLLLDEDAEGMPWSIHERIVSSMNYALGIFTSSFMNKNTWMDWFLSLESDVLLGPETINQLIATATKMDCKVVHSNCYPGFNLSLEVVDANRITLGCTLIHREVFDSVKHFRYDKDALNAFHDAFFASDCHNAGIRMVYDPSIYVQHLQHYGGTRGWNELPESETKGK